MMIMSWIIFILDKIKLYFRIKNLNINNKKINIKII